MWGWLDDRLGIGGLRYPVPEHANSLAYTLGGITLASFVGLVLTGIYLAQFYDPTPEAAHASVTYITDTVFAGELIRSLHYWLSSLFVITLVLHLVRTFATASFKAPREMTWISGVALFFLTAGLLFSGTVLKADQEAILLIDESLSRPLGADQGKALHEAGREYRPATGAQEIVGIIARRAASGRPARSAARPPTRHQRPLSHER